MSIRAAGVKKNREAEASRCLSSLMFSRRRTGNGPQLKNSPLVLL